MNQLRNQIKILKDYYADEKARCDAAEALGEMGDKRAAKHLTGVLSERKEKLTVSVINALGKIGDRRSLEKVISTVNNELSRRDNFDTYISNIEIVCSTAMEALIRNPEVMLQPLLREVNDWYICRLEETSYVQFLIDVLGEMKASQAYDILIKILDDDDLKHCISVARVRGQIGLKEDKDFKLCISAARALGKIGLKEAEGPLLRALKICTETNEGAIWALGQIGSRSAVPFLLDLLNSNDYIIETAQALGEIGDISAIEPLTKIMCELCFEDESSDYARRVLTGALVKLGKSEWENILESNTVDYKRFAKIKNPCIRKMTIERLKRDKKPVDAAIRVAVELGTKSMEKPLKKLLYSNDKNTAKLAAHAIIRIAKRNSKSCVIDEETKDKIERPHEDNYLHDDWHGPDWEYRFDKSSDCAHGDTRTHIDSGGLGIAIEDF